MSVGKRLFQLFFITLMDMQIMSDSLSQTKVLEDVCVRFPHGEFMYGWHVEDSYGNVNFRISKF